MNTADTIAAISSPPGMGWRGIVRLSGPEAWPLVQKILCADFEPIAHRWRDILLPHPPVPAGLIFFRAPRSFTGQDMLELHLPGSMPLLNMVLRTLLAAGARQAQAGEFSARAFLNGKCDLTEAEGIAATIAARNARQLRAAAGLREGALHRWTKRRSDSLADLLALVEAGIDFSDEPEISLIGSEDLGRRISDMLRDIAELREHALRWESFDTLPTVVLLGRPNVGKSSLLNVLSGQERAIVSPQAGATRDSLAATAPTPDGPVRLLDAAGVEDQGRGMALLLNQSRRHALLAADGALLVIDERDTPDSVRRLMEELADSSAWKILVRNKMDIPDGLGAAPRETGLEFVAVSARTGENLADLLRLIGRRVKEESPLAEEYLALNARHRHSLEQAAAALRRGFDMTRNAGAERFPELVAGDLRAALDALGAISGTISADDVLGRIFGSFCIGK